MLRNIAMFVLFALWAYHLTACRRGLSNEGYLVTRSEQFIQHYQGSPCGSVPSAYRRNLSQSLACDVPELRVTFLHGGVKFVGTCQYWNDSNQCRQLRVGAIYSCKVDSESITTPPSQWLVCTDHGFLAIESSELSR